MTAEEAASAVFDLASEGWLIGVEVFGAECDDGHEANYGLCDVDGPYTVGSDCNRAEPYITRPADPLINKHLRTLLTGPNRGHKAELWNA